MYMHDMQFKYFSADLHNHYFNLEEISGDIKQSVLEKSHPFMSSEYSTVLSDVYKFNAHRNEGGAVFYTGSQDFIIWVNEEPHLRFISNSNIVNDNVKQTIIDVFQALQR